MKYLTLLMFFIIGCGNAQTNEDIESGIKELELTWEKPYTQEIEHFQFGMKFWNTDFLKGNTKQFPERLKRKNEYEIFFTPGMMQGKSIFFLKIEFPNKRLARKYFSEKTDGIYKEEFENLTEFKESDYCNEIDSYFKSGYVLPLESKVRLINPVLCIGKGLNRSTRFISGIALNEKDKMIMCWAIDAN